MLNRTSPDASPDEAFTELDQYLLDELVPTRAREKHAAGLGHYIVKLARLVMLSSLHGAEGRRLARVAFPGGEALLADLIAADPVYFLGEEHLRRYGANPMVLVKYLDSAVRLPFQVHPTVDFSRRNLNAESGKTEAYYILSTRPEVEEHFVYLGFQRPPGRQELRRMILEQDIAALEHCFDKIPVQACDVYVVPGGLPTCHRWRCAYGRDHRADLFCGAGGV